MRKIYLTALSLLSLGVQAQNIESSTSVLNFSSTNELQLTTDTVIVRNPGIYPVEVTDVDLFSIYGDEPFTLTDTAFTIAAQDSFLLEVSFTPEHNIMHNMALVLKTNTGFGHVGVELKAQGTYSKTYYASTQNLTEESLKLALKTCLGQGYTQLSYSGARDNMYATIDNDGGDVECVYTGRTATFNTRSGANSNSFNCEHTFPQGFFNQNLPMRSDIHHLFSTDVTANSQRGNLPFGVVSSASWTQGGSKKSSSLFEPRDAHKGACARAMMYFVIRYQDYSNHFSGQESILRQWHNTYAPSVGEKDRNDAIFNVQNNRNPFVDYPQFEERITNFVSNSAEAPNASIYFSDDTLFMAKAAGHYNYHFVAYNDGNQNITLSGFALSDTSLTFAGGNPNTVTLAPGDVYDVNIRFNAANIYANELLTLSVDGQVETFPIYSTGNVLIGLKENKVSTVNQVKIYPNPVHETLQLESLVAIKSVKVVNAAGEVVPAYFNESNERLQLNEIPEGIYLLEITLQNGEKIIERVVKN